jgi:hypothetical protein
MPTKRNPSRQKKAGARKVTSGQKQAKHARVQSKGKKKPSAEV